MEERSSLRPLSGLGEDTAERGASERPGISADRFKLLNETISEGLKILKQSERHLPDTVERLSPSTKKQLSDLIQSGLAQWRKASEEINDDG